MKTQADERIIQLKWTNGTKTGSCLPRENLTKLVGVGVGGEDGGCGRISDLGSTTVSLEAVLSLQGRGQCRVTQSTWASRIRT
jgi:hypothetical protein